MHKLVQKKSLWIITIVALLVTMLMPAGIAYADNDGYINIASEADLKNITDMDGNYRLVNDIELSGNWSTPIGDATNPFNGTFDGGNHALTGFRMQTTASKSYVGLFGYVGNQGLVENLKIKPDDGAKIAGNEYVGAVAGYTKGTIKNCGIENAELQSNSYNISGKKYVGGIAGYTEGTVEACYNRSSVYASDANAGGITGYCNGSVIDSYNNTPEISANSGYAGGITGRLSSGLVKNCYSVGKITTSSSPARGNISGSGSSTVENCYYNYDESLNGSLKGNGGIPMNKWNDTGCSTTIANPNSNAFQDDLDPNINNGYPILIWEVAGSENPVDPEVEVSSIEIIPATVDLKVGEKSTLVAKVLPANATNPQVTWSSNDNSVATISENGEINAIAEGSIIIKALAGEKVAECNVNVTALATETEPQKNARGVYQIGTNQELAWFAKNAENTADADLTADLNIGEADYLPMFTNGYEGRFDGKDYQINYQINTGATLSGLFHTIGENGTVANLKVAGNLNINKDKKNYFGGIAAKNKGSIFYCENNVAIDAGTLSVRYAGGIAGSNEGGSISLCKNHAPISVASYAGGIAGENKAGKISNSENNGAISSQNISGVSGGIISVVTASKNTDKMSVASCTNNASVTGGTGDLGTAGGIIGQENVPTSAAGYESKPELTISKCVNNGTLTAGRTGDLIAKVSDNGNCTIIYVLEGSTEVEEAKKNLALYDEDIKSGNVKEAKSYMTLPSTYSATGVNITWQTNNTDIVNIKTIGTGIMADITLPEKGEAVPVTLTATITKGQATDTKTFSFKVWSKEAIQKEQTENDAAYLNTAIEDLKKTWFKLRPVSGKDTNINQVMEKALADLGYNQVDASLKNCENPQDGKAGIENDGKINYFYDDPAGSRLMWFASIPTTFEFSKNAATVSYDINAIIYWDKVKVEKYLKDEIVANITVPNQVENDLELPKYLGNKGGKTWVEISWQSNDEDALAISDENQWANADARYNPYLGKVLRSDQDVDVTLTATYTFNRTNDVAGAEQAIKLTKTYPVTVKKMDGNAWAEEKNKMQQALDQNYDLNKLTDFVTGEKLDLDAVKNDIQFLIPKETGIANYFDYKFTVISSDSNVIETPGIANAARGFVYRPLPGKSDETAKITIFMTSRKNPNLTATKTFDVKVKALNQNEIDSALNLMNLAKANYFAGINDNRYNDEYSVNGNLISFNEVTWNDDQTDLKWIYHNNDVTNNGIVADELDNWAEQEAWRAFRSSHPNIIDHETLNYLNKPNEDTFVRINSVLTHEIFGKYYTKFGTQQGYEDFAALYKQPVSTHMLIEGINTKLPEYNQLPDAEREQKLEDLREDAISQMAQPLNIDFALQGKDHTLIQTNFNDVEAGATVFEVFRKALDDAGYTYTAKGSYVQSITDPFGNTLAELSNGANSGWMYKVNNSYPNTYMNARTLEDGDKVTVLYTQDYTKEPGIGNTDDKSNNENSQVKDIISVEVKANATVNEKGLATANIDKATIDKAIEQALEKIAKEKDEAIAEIIIKTDNIAKAKAKALEATLDTDSIKEIVKVKNAQLTIQSDIGKLTFDNKTLVDLAKDLSINNKITFKIAKVDNNNLDKNIKQAVNNNQVFALELKIKDQNIHNFAGAIKVSLPYNQEANVDPNDLTVYYVDDNGKVTQMTNVKYDSANKSFNFETNHFSYFFIAPKVAKSNFFTDIAQDAWYYEAVKYVFDNNLMNGVEDNKFAPNNNMSRAMLATVLYRYEGEPSVADMDKNAFKDVAADQWYTDAIIWANNKQIIKGYGNDLFGTNDNITREQVATIIMRYANYKEITTTNNSNKLEQFKDADQVSSWAKEAMGWANTEELIKGRTTTEIAPKGNITRAEVATILMRCIEDILN